MADNDNPLPIQAENEEVNDIPQVNQIPAANNQNIEHIEPPYNQNPA